MSRKQCPVFTIGHSTRPIEEFLGLLEAARVHCVVDVRRLPGSRAFPQYDAQSLAGSLARHDIAYWHLPALCGRRTAGEVRDLPVDDFWTNASFARYARWANGDAFQRGLDELIERTHAERCTLMCSEAVWWRCHRRIISDHLLARGLEVCHIMAPGKVVPASLTEGALIRDGQVVYPAQATASRIGVSAE